MDMGSVLAKLFNRREEIKILLTGLDGAGKTTILYKLKLGETVNRPTYPTIGYNVETIQINDISYITWEVSSRHKMSPLLRLCLDNTKAIVYVIDSNDQERLSEAAEEFRWIAQEDELRDVVILIFANKQDLPNAKSPMVISETLQLHKLRQHSHIIPTVATTGEGLADGLGWIAEMLTRKHLPKDSEEIVKLKEYRYRPTTEKSGVISTYFKQSWNIFYSLFVGSSEPQVVK